MQTTRNIYLAALIQLMLAIVLLGTTRPSCAADAPAETKPLLTDFQFQKILDDIAVNGKTGAFPARITAALGLTRDSQTLLIRQDAFKDKAGTIHLIATINNNIGYIVGFGDYKKQIYDFYLNADRVLVSAISISPKEEIAAFPNKDAQKLLDTEWIYWCGIANKQLK